MWSIASLYWGRDMGMAGALGLAALQCTENALVSVGIRICLCVCIHIHVLMSMHVHVYVHVNLYLCGCVGVGVCGLYARAGV